MELRERILADMKTAMKERNQPRLDTIRFLQSAIKNREIELRPNPMNPDEILGVLKKLVKQRKESIEQFQAAGRQDLVDKESSELKILEDYLPAQLSREAVIKVVTEVIAELKATGPKEMGLVMKTVLAKTGGAADNKMVSEVVKAKLQP